VKSASDLKREQYFTPKYWYQHTSIHQAFIFKNATIGNSLLTFSLHAQMHYTYIPLWIIIQKGCT
jgi:hypothetical protein